MSESIPPGTSVRDHLREPGTSLVERYAWFVIGEMSWRRLLAYELVTTLFGPIPGAIGLALRKVFYPSLFENVGRGVTFGRDIVIRHPARIHLGDAVHLDDGCLLDARGAGDAGVVLGDRVIVGRNAHVQAKVGPIRVGSDTVIGQDSLVVAQGGIEIGEDVSIAGHCRISGGLFRIPSDGGPVEHYTTGPIRLRARCMLGGGATVLDGVTIGEGAYVGAGAVVSADVPAYAVAAARPPLVLGRGEGDGARPSEGAEAAVSADDGTAPREPAVDAGEPGEAGDPRTLAAVLAAIEEVNLQLPAADRVPLSPRARLWGEGAPLDSLRLVNLLVLVEERVEEAYGEPLNLSDAAEQMDDRSNPFATAGSLARYIDELQGR